MASSAVIHLECVMVISVGLGGMVDGGWIKAEAGTSYGWKSGLCWCPTGVIGWQCAENGRLDFIGGKL